jgi:glucose-1-phosphate adenylyltransferase
MNNNKVLGICNLYTAPSLGGLTQHRSYGSVTMLGRYALIDFTLSNFSNSGIDSVATLVPEFPNSVHTHIRSGSTWTANMKTGFQYISHNDTPNLPKIYNTDIRNILFNIIFFKSIRFDTVVIAPSHYLSSMDFRPIIDAHEESGNDCYCGTSFRG